LYSREKWISIEKRVDGTKKSGGQMDILTNA